MIIFDLDGTLADCQHRRHFVDPLSSRPHGEDYSLSLYSPDLNMYYYNLYANGKRGFFYHKTNKRWEPDWKSFYEACDQDEVILPIYFIFLSLKEKFGIEHPIQIWSGRCESVKDKTIHWLQKHFSRDIYWVKHLKMRPIGDSTPDDELKERWLDETIIEGKNIDFVFDDRPKVIKMWRRRGVFVFNCAQYDEEF